MLLHRVDHTTVQQGRVSVSGLALPDGQQVEVLVMTPTSGEKRGIAVVRDLLRGGVEKFSMPFDATIPEDSWEMLK